MTFLSFTERGIRRITVANLGRGSLVIQPAPGEEVVGSLNCSDPDLLAAASVRVQGDQLRIDLPVQFGGQAVQVQLNAPPGLDHRVLAGDADVAVDVPAGRVEVTSGSGDVRIGTAAEVVVTTGSGDVNVDRVTGPSARVSSASGQLRLGEVAGAVQAKTGSGAITVSRLTGELHGATASGDISVPATTGTVELRSASGSLTVGVADDLPAWLDLHSATGHVRIALDATSQPGPGEPYVSIRARTASGEIAVYRA